MVLGAIAGSYGRTYPQAVTKNKQTDSPYESKSENLPTTDNTPDNAEEAAGEIESGITDYRQLFIQEYIENLFVKIENGDTEPTFQIGNQSFTIKEWDEFLEKFDSAEDAIQELVEEEIEKRKQEEQKASLSGIGKTEDYSNVESADAAETYTERIDVDNSYYTVKKGEDSTIEIYDKATGVSYTFDERYLSIQTDAGTGDQFLISDIPYTTMNVSAMKLTPELKMAMEEYRNGDAITEKALDSKFTLTCVWE